MAAHSYADLIQHDGHNVVVVSYGYPEVGTVNVAIECEDCYTVLLDFDRPESNPEVSVCSACGSEEVFYDAYVGVNDGEDVRTFDAVFCDNCGGETSLKQLTEGETNA